MDYKQIDDGNLLLAFIIHYGIGEYSTVHFSVTLQSNFECLRLGYCFLSIILVLEKCNLGPWKVLEFCTLSLLRTLIKQFCNSYYTCWQCGTACILHVAIASCQPCSNPSISLLFIPTAAYQLRRPDRTDIWVQDSFIDHVLHTILPSVLWHCWLGGRKGIRPVKNWAVGCWHGSVWSKVQTCIWPSWCQCRSLSLAPVKSRLVLPFCTGSPG